MPPVPHLLIADDDPANHLIAAGVLAAAGWRVDRADDGRAAVAIAARRRYALILMEIEMPGLDGFGAVAAIRAGGGKSASAPILAFTVTSRIGSSLPFHAAGIDGHLAKPCTPETLRTAVETWRPAGIPAATTRLGAIFGQTEIAALLQGFRDQLKAALAADDARLHSEAHRLAGIAGTLGFPDVSRAWLAVSEGDDTAVSEARISARKALAGIDAFHM